MFSSLVLRNADIRPLGMHSTVPRVPERSLRMYTRTM
jgi:hypothetical protein